MLQTPAVAAFAAALLTAFLAFAYSMWVLKAPLDESKKVFFKTTLAALAAATAVALAARRSHPAASAQPVGDPFFAPL